jgi:intracellular septation protein A
MNEKLARAWELLRAGAYDFGGIAVFYLLLWTAGLKAAIAGTIVFVAVDVWRRRRMGLGFPRIYVLSSALVVVFGLIDLWSDNPFMIKYEAVISSLAVAGMFALGARGKSMIQEMAEQQNGGPLEGDPELPRFFQLMTLMWAAYFVIKAIVYLWIGMVMPIERAMTVRTVLGTGSLIALIAISTQGKWLFAGFRRCGLLKPAAETVAPHGG